ncbi:hypothetical protein Tco_0993394 [Tanacetum coccineum]|uniref:Uncharacterized protein n=1 Tax=Tanacetum coccineum TaxID=301880 RepID=A0ABQ5F556_9ASTR
MYYKFWDTVKAKTVNREVQLQALVDKKKVIITESTIRRDLQLEDVKGTEYLPTATIFEKLTRIGYEKLTQKLTFYKAFFSPQSLEIDSLKRRVKKLEKKQRSRTHKLRRLYKVGLSAKVISSDDEASLGDQGDASKQGRKILDIDVDEDITLDSTHVDIDPNMFEVHDLHGDEVFVEIEKHVVNAATTTTITATTTVADEVEMTFAQTLIEIKSAKPKAKGIVMQEPSESTLTISSQQPS